MGTTPVLSLPYPEGTDAPAGDEQIQALAEAVDNLAVTGPLRSPSYVAARMTPTTFTLRDSDSGWNTIAMTRVAGSDDTQIVNNGAALTRAGTWRISATLAGTPSTATGFTGAALYLNIGGSGGATSYGCAAIFPFTASLRTINSVTGYCRVPSGGSLNVVCQARAFINPTTTTVTLQHADLVCNWIGD